MLDIRELLNLKEAYAEVYAPQELTEEQIWEGVEVWVNALLEEGYDLSDYTWEEMYEDYLSEMGQKGGGRVTGSNPNVYKPATTTSGPAGGGMGGRRGGGSSPGGLKPASTPAKPAATPASRPPSRFAGARDAAVAKAQNIKGSPVVGPKPASAPAKPAAASRPAATTPAAKPAAATTPVAKPAGSAMDQFAKANPKLAASAAERDRTRGTSATTNPLMKDMKSRLPAPKTPSPTTAKTGFDLAKKGVNLAAGFDMFDVVMGHLLDEGYADTQEAALAIMTNMSEDWRKSIVEAQEARNNPEKYEDEQRKKKSKRQRAMDDPDTGINSPAFAAFMKKQMGR
jgi:hypothetical protein